MADPDAGNHVLTIVPWFGMQQVTAKEWSGTALDGTKLGQDLVSLYWPQDGSWIEGQVMRHCLSCRVARLGSNCNPQGGSTEANASEAIPLPIPEFTSYGILDRLLAMLTDRGLFPNLELLTVAGISAGGQTVQRRVALLIT